MPSMRVKLTVTNPDRGAEPRTYVLDQDPIVIGRAGTCALPLDDPDRVVSKEHAEIRRTDDGLRVFDLGSKNQTFVGGKRVGTAGLPVADGDQIQVGPFHIDVALDLGLLVADDLDRTVFGAAFMNPFQETAESVASALGQLRRAYAETDLGPRNDALEDALRDAFGPGQDAEFLADLVRGSRTAAVPAVQPDAHVARAFVPEAPPAAPPAAAPAAAADAELLLAIATAAARLVSIPGQFRHEFLGHTVIHAPDTAFLFDADVDALVAHLSHDDPAERAERRRLLGHAAEAVLHHHQALLEGYRAAARDGAAALVDALDPDRFGDDVGGGLMPGARERALLDMVRQRCDYLRAESFAAAERRVYRPAFTQAYLDCIARALPATTPDP